MKPEQTAEMESLCNLIVNCQMEAVQCLRLWQIESPSHCWRGDTGHRAGRWKMGAESGVWRKLPSDLLLLHTANLGAWDGDLGDCSY